MATVSCIFAALIPVSPKNPCPLHEHSCTELVYYTKGHGLLELQDKQFAYNPGELSVSHARMPHADTPAVDGEQICFGVTGSMAETLKAGLWQNIPVEIGKDLLRLKCEMEHPTSPLKQTRIDLIAGWIIVELLRIQTPAASAPQTSTPKQVQSTREILDTRYNETINFEKLAGSLYISPDHLRHLFKQNVGESPIQYLIRKRLDAARELLTFTNQPVHKIAEQVGLENPYYFSRIFKKRIGCSPSEYRSRHQDNS
ncbi:AraC family transcriptional regulator [Coraliomargarita parva]|uniref:AraC family transcriptional regulator n=1 Tax=Coraliomargarita parva TaxID=3014050 RepID=UPI0022B3B886|nr:AraC family transcriptional regulator [Coraliomargarita parva]